MLVGTGRGSCFCAWANSSIAQAHSAEVSSSAGTTASFKVVCSCLESGNGTSMSGNLTLVMKSFVISFAFSFTFTMFL